MSGRLPAFPPGRPHTRGILPDSVFVIPTKIVTANNVKGRRERLTFRENLDFPVGAEGGT
jgi:hypothetical protein